MKFIKMQLFKKHLNKTKKEHQPVSVREILSYEWNHVLEQNLQIHCSGERAVEDLQWRGAFARNGAPQMQRGLLSRRLRRIGRLAFELIERGQERLE